MTSKLKEISSEELHEVVHDAVVLRGIERDDLRVFVVTTKQRDDKEAPLVDIEISLRKCERLGVFGK